METIQYAPQGVCSRKMEIDVEDGVIQAVRVMGGCNGNLQGISSLLEGALRVYQGRAFYDGTGGLERSELERLSRLYGLIVL